MRVRALGFVVATVLATASLTVIATVATPDEAAVAATPGCDYADSGSGAYADTICWVNFADYNTAAAMTPEGQAMTAELPGGYTAAFVVKARPPAGAVDVSDCVTPYTAPFLGTVAWPLGGRGYTGIAGRPGLLNGDGLLVASPPARCYGLGKGVNLILEQIEVTDSSGAEVTNYGVVSTESEASTSASSERIVWTSDVLLSRIDQINPTGAGCTGARVTGLGTNTVTCIGSNVGSGWGTSVIFASSPTQFSTASINPGRILGTAYGFVTSKVRLNAVVDGPGDFTVNAGAVGGDTVATGTTSDGSGTTGEVTVLSGGDFALGVEAASGTDLDDYLQSWACERNGIVDPALQPTGSVVTATPSIGDFVDCTVTLILGQPAISLVKSATPTDAASFDRGQTITYTYAVTNTGNVPLTGVAVAEVEFTGAGSTTPVCPVDTLAPAGQVLCSSTYQLTQDDIDQGEIANTAVAAGQSEFGPATSDESSVTIPGDQASAITLVKSASPATGSVAGDDIEYSFTVTNAGNVTLSGLAIVEDDFTGAGAFPLVECPDEANPLAPGEIQTCTATYPLAQADVDDGSIGNTARAVANPPSGEPITSAPSSALVTIPAAPGIELVKSADRSTVVAEDQLISYSFTVTNTGNVTLTGLAIAEESFSGAGTMSAIECPTTSVDPDSTVTCTANYRTVAADVEAGEIINTASASAVSPGDSTVDSALSTAAVVVTETPDDAGLAITGGADLRGLMLPAGLVLAFGMFLALRVTRTRRVH